MLLYTGISRSASTVLTEQNSNARETKADLVIIREHAFQLKQLMRNGFSPQQLGEVLHETWMHKRNLANSVSNDRIDSWYQTALDAGALGGKICGAGGGGFLLLIVEPRKRGELREALSDLQVMEVGYEPQGSQIVCRGE
jgi:D-glycero-alpha-D-manno-heptose-7-phosphate kinase